MTTDRLPPGFETYLYSETNKPQHRDAQNYFLRRLGHPDRSSEFGRSLGPLKYAFRCPVIGELLLRPRLWYDQSVGRDALLLDQEENGIIGHTAFHIHQNDGSMHIFSVEVAKALREKGLGGLMVGELVDKAILEHRPLRIGGGRNEAVNRIYRTMAQRSDVRDGGGNWILPFD